MRRDYGPDVLAEGAGRRRCAEFPQVPAERGLVVEQAGVDHLPSIVAGFAPGPARGLGVLVDHLVTGFVTAPGTSGPAGAFEDRRPAQKP